MVLCSASLSTWLTSFRVYDGLLLLRFMIEIYFARKELQRHHYSSSLHEKRIRIRKHVDGRPSSPKIIQNLKISYFNAGGIGSMA